MKKLLLCLLVVLCCVGCRTSAPPPAPVAPAIETGNAAATNLESMTVALVKQRHGEWRAYCSGVWVGANEVITAYHCVADAETGEIDSTIFVAQKKDEVGEKIERAAIASVAKTDLPHDVALVHVPLHMWPHLIAPMTANPVKGEAVQNMGQSLGRLTWSYSTGVVAAVRELDLSGDGDGLDPKMQWVQTTASVSPGNSGGGLFDFEGNLLGVCSRGPEAGQNLNLFVHVKYVRALIRN